MFDDLTAVLIVFAGVAMIVTLRYLKLKSQTMGQMNAQENSALEQMAMTARRLEQRVATLERILDTDSPGWRSNPANFCPQASNE